MVPAAGASINVFDLQGHVLNITRGIIALQTESEGVHLKLALHRNVSTLAAAVFALKRHESRCIPLLGNPLTSR